MRMTIDTLLYYRSVQRLTKTKANLIMAYGCMHNDRVFSKIKLIPELIKFIIVAIYKLYYS